MSIGPRACARISSLYTLSSQRRRHDTLPPQRHIQPFFSGHDRLPSLAVQRLRDIGIDVFHVKRWAVALTLALAFSPSLANADTPSPNARSQFNAGIVGGIAGVGSSSELWQQTRFHLGLKGDVLLGRSSPDDWGLGPMVGVSTNGFDDLNLAAGLSVLAPVHEYLPIVLSVGPRLQAKDGWEPGAFASLFWGSRSFNYHASYGLAAGLLLEGRMGFGDSKERTAIIAAQIDLQAVALPIIFLINVFR